MASSYPLIDQQASLGREAALLAPYATHSHESRGRAHPEPAIPLRTCFQRDRDRVVHSTAFRRLEYKTQVFVNHEGDHYRTRLTHTLEVAQIARSIARVLALNEELTEAIALAHDVGHPPFGHAGEEALDELMADHGGFNHNWHGLRVLDHLETRYPEFDGLNLSWEVRESTIKHGGHRRDRLPEEFEPSWTPCLEAQVTDIADSLAYLTHDIDDGLRSGFISLAELRGFRLWGEAEGNVRERYPGGEEKALVARAMSSLIDRQVHDLIETTHSRLRGHGISTVRDVREFPEPLVGFSTDMTRRTDELKEFLRESLYRHYRTLRMAAKAQRFLRALFTEYVRDPRLLPPAHRERAEGKGAHGAVCDYLAGMTDRFCQEEYQRLFHPFERI